MTRWRWAEHALALLGAVALVEVVGYGVYRRACLRRP